MTEENHQMQGPLVDPSPVKVENVEPIPVEVMQDEPLRVRTEQDKVAATRVTSSDKALAEAKVNADMARALAIVDARILQTEDQRKISRIWESTQQRIALIVVVITVLVAAAKALHDMWFSDGGVSVGTSFGAGPAFLFLVAASNLVIGFYFGRTNHTRVGGSLSPEDEAKGR